MNPFLIVILLLLVGCGAQEVGISNWVQGIPGEQIVDWQSVSKLGAL